MMKEFINSINFYDITPDRNFFHPISDRGYWDAFSEKYLDKLIEVYEKITAEPRKELTASLYLDYKRTNNRTRFQDVYHRRREELLFATLIECCRNDGALMDDILDLTWMILEETTWCNPAHNNSVEIADGLPYHKQWSITICSTVTAVKMAFVYQAIGEKLDEISKMVTLRIKEVIKEKVLSEMLERDDYWWMGFGSRKPNNIGIWNWRNAMIAALIVVDDDADFLRKFILKSIVCMDQYIDNQGEEGGCNEGPSYWFHSHGNVIEAIEVMNKATGNAFADCLKSEKVRNMSKFLMKMYSGGKYFVNFADGSPVIGGGALFVYRCGKLTGVDEVCDFAARWGKESGQTNPIVQDAEMYRMLENLRYYDEYMNHKAPDEAGNEFYLPDLGVMTARVKGKDGELFLGAKAGHNGESHNHNDVGNFIVYKNGVRFIVDSGPLTYSALTFSDKRYTLWTNQSQYHNLPIIDGFGQLNSPKGIPQNESYSSENVSYIKEENVSALSMSIKNAYENRNEINAFDRKIEINKTEMKAIVTDSFDLGKETAVTWVFLTHQKPVWDGTKVLLSSESGEKLEIKASGAGFEFKSETVEYDDKEMERKWGKELYRSMLSANVNCGNVIFEIM